MPDRPPAAHPRIWWDGYDFLVLWPEGRPPGLYRARTVADIDANASGTVELTAKPAPSPAGAIVITNGMLGGSGVDPRAVIHARISGERPDCDCQPIHAYPGGPVVGYSRLCDAHEAAMRAQEARDG